MNITEQTITSFKLSPEEKKALLTTYEILSEIGHKYNKYIAISNFNTGEIIEIDELPRVRGIVSAILEGDIWEAK